MNVRVICGSATRAFGEAVASWLKVPLVSETSSHFSDGEIGIDINESVRGQDVYVVNSCAHPVNESLMETFLLIDALRRSSASRITAVLPYFAYGRQDRKLMSRVPISAALVAHLLESAGADRILSVDLHCGQIQGFFRIPVDNLFAVPSFIQKLVRMREFFSHEKIVVVSPDAGGAERADFFRDSLEKEGISAGMAVMNKKREVANVVKSMELIGDVDGAVCLIVDDMIDTAGTLCFAASTLKQHGATMVYALATHGLFSGPAMERINDSVLEKVFISDTLPLRGEVISQKIVRISVAPLVAEAIRRLRNEESISSLFELS